MDTQIRTKILSRKKKIPSNKLKELDDFITKIETSSTQKKNKSLSFAGAWKNIDTEIFSAFTENLIENRQKNITRYRLINCWYGDGE